MRINLSANCNKDFPQRLLKIGERKITSPSTGNSSSSEIKLDDILGLIINRLEHLKDGIYLGLENVLERNHH
jgi:hypothetical protein